jgi:hypothetical protein
MATFAFLRHEVVARKVDTTDLRAEEELKRLLKSLGASPLAAKMLRQCHVKAGQTGRTYVSVVEKLTRCLSRPGSGEVMRVRTRKGEWREPESLAIAAFPAWALRDGDGSELTAARRARA